MQERKNDMKKRIAALLAAMCVGMLAGCTRTEITSSGAESTASVSADVEFVEELKEPTGSISVTLLGEDANRLALLQEIADKYIADRPTVEISFRSVANAEEMVKLLAAGEKADLVELTRDTLPGCVQQELLRNFSPYLTDFSDKGTFTSAARQGFRAVGKNSAYLVPNSFTQQVLYYRTDRMGGAETKAEEGLRRPHSWESLEPLLEAFGDRTLAIAGKEDLVSTLDTFVWSAAGMTKMFGAYAPYYTMIDNEVSTVFALPEMAEELELFGELFRKGVVKEALDWTEEQAVAAFADGQAALLFSGEDTCTALSAAMDPHDWAADGFLRGSGNCVMEGDYTGWAVASSSENSDTAVGFLLYLCSADNATHYAKEMETAPIYRESLEMEPSLSEGKTGPLSYMIRHPDWYYFVNRPGSYAACEGYETFARPLVLSYLEGTLSEEALLGELDAYWMRAYAEEGQMW